ncbi:hypothetical protein [Clostridium saccharobutylicum]|uniref:hypothetical protein n=1 Tax=Clostridium saccharobutylicum TaxID=169679 RepID=UPI00156E3EFC|nr:hypothetical protein [Clostridium saccharobutylicum]NSB89069.1 hypothetical protein [Clostridium saccharobutylicum]NYC30917.1 hypothetical protein [Clostridium saccharobutylicum]
MISVIKTAIITIIISFISGLLLDYYKGLAPRILCNIGKGVPLVMNNKKICAYILTVRNISNKTIHNISLNVQGSQNNLRSGDAKITKGLKFDSSEKNNVLDVSIPFLSKNDEFSVTLYVENQYGVYNKPVATIRSPENFKEINSVKQIGILSGLFNIPKSISNVFSNTVKDNEAKAHNKKRDSRTYMSNERGNKKTGNGKLSKNKKAMIAIASLILVISIGGVGAFYYKQIAASTQTPDTKTNVQKQSNDTTESTNGTTKNTDTKSLTGGTTKNSGTKSSTNETTKNSGAKSSTSGTNENTDLKASTDGTGKNANSKSSTNGTTESTDTKTSGSGTTKNTDAKTSASGTSASTDMKTPVSGTSGNMDAKTSTTGTTGNTADTKTSTSGTNENSTN